jgi:hypothetical protein
MASRQCYHCKQWVDEGAAHDCWTTTERALTAELSPELKEAWERLRETAMEFGEQRIYASHNSIMFSRQSCYFFVRPKKRALEVCIFLGRTVKAPQIRRTQAASRTKMVHTVHIVHRDEVEPPIADWLREAYEVSPTLGNKAAPKTTAGKPKKKAAIKRSVAGKTRKRAVRR